MKHILTFALFLMTLPLYSQNELDKADNCDIDIFKIIGEVYFAYGSSECVYFQIQLLPDNFTLLVFDALNKTDLIYQTTFISGQRQGYEMIIIDNEKVITPYLNGQKEGKSFTFYKNGNIRYERIYKKGKLVGRIKEFDREGQLVRKIKPNK